MHYKQLHYTAGSIAAELECNKDPSSQSSRERARTSLIATSSFVWILVPASTSGRYRTISSSLINEKKAQPPPKKNLLRARAAAAHRGRSLRRSRSRSCGRAGTCSRPWAPLLQPSPCQNRPKEKKKKKRLLKKNALFSPRKSS